MEADMRTMVPTVAGLLTLVAVSAQAAPLPQPRRARPNSAPLRRSNWPPGVRLALASRSLAGPLGLLRLGALLSELVTSAGRCDCAHRMDHAEWSDLAIHRGLRRRRLSDWVRP